MQAVLPPALIGAVVDDAGAGDVREDNGGHDEADAAPEYATS